jgi:hypothetical protein
MWCGDGLFTHATIITMEAGLTTPDDHIDAIRRFRHVADDLSYGSSTPA